LNTHRHLPRGAFGEQRGDFLTGGGAFEDFAAENQLLGVQMQRAFAGAIDGIVIDQREDFAGQGDAAEIDRRVAVSAVTGNQSAGISHAAKAYRGVGVFARRVMRNGKC
jgi:hypothetical protein